MNSLATPPSSSRKPLTDVTTSKSSKHNALSEAISTASTLGTPKKGGVKISISPTKSSSFMKASTVVKENRENAPLFVEPQAGTVADIALSTPTSISSSSRFKELEPILLTLTVFSYLPTTSLTTLTTLSKPFKSNLLSDPEYYRALCTNLATERNLYLPLSNEGLTSNVGYWKKLFETQLWPVRNKWLLIPSSLPSSSTLPAPSNQNTQSFKIQVACRFRPGPQKNETILLPLHQRLKLLRQEQRSKKKLSSSTSSPSSSMLLGGDNSSIPPQYICALMGTTMVNPYKTPSQKACEMKVLQQHFRRSSKDPFDARVSCRIDDCCEMSGLREEIEAWKSSSSDLASSSNGATSNRNNKFRVSQTELKTLTSNGGEVSAELLEALLIAEELEREMIDAEDEVNRELRGKLRGKKDDEKDDEDWRKTGISEEVDAVLQFGKHSLHSAMERTFKSEKDEATLDQILSQSLTRQSRILSLEKSRVLMHVDGIGIRPFLLSGGVCDCDVGQKEVYERVASGSVTSLLNGFNSCVLAYGQTGSGKSFTVFGPCGEIERARDGCFAGDGVSGNSHSGISIRACEEICAGLGIPITLNDLTPTDNNEKKGRGSLSVQYVQIYNEQVTCLLTESEVEDSDDNANANNSNAKVRIIGDQMIGAKTIKITSLSSLLDLLLLADAMKFRAATAMNDHSSRAHSVLCLNVTQSLNDAVINSTMHLVDLAGSERLKKSKVEGQRRVEAIGINKSLMVLGKVVNALVEKKSHVPYFESKLTHILKGALGGNSRTTAIVNCRMDDEHANESLQSLRFGERCSAISNSVASKATNATEMKKGIDAAIKNCEDQIRGLEERGLTRMEAYWKMKERLRVLKVKTEEIAVAVVVVDSVK